MKIDKQKIFIYISMILIIGLIILYSCRFIYFKYFIDNKTNVISDLSTRVIEQNILLNEDGNYYFTGKANTNYVVYSSQLWQIVSLNKKELTLISVKPITNMYYDFAYEESLINNYLNTNFYNILDKSLLKETTTCTNNIVGNKDDCSKEYKANIVLPSLSLYNKIGGKDSYINNGYYTYLSNEGENHYYIDNNGSIGLSSNKLLGIKPMITIKSTDIVTGSGLENDPYVLDTPKTILKDAFVGSYVSFNDKLWRILDNTDITKLIYNDTIEKHLYQRQEFTSGNSLYEYLNNAFYNSLDNKYMKSFTSYNGTFDGNVNALYKEVTSYVSIPYLFDLYLNDVDNYALTTYMNYSDAIYTINESGITSASESNEFYVRPVIALQNNLSIEGSGTINSPYIIKGEVNEEN